MNWLIKCSVIILFSTLSACGGSSGSNESTMPPGYTSPSTDYATTVTHNSAKLVGSFSNADGYTTTSRFEYGTTTAYGSNTPATDYATLGAVNFETSITLLQPSTTYHFRVVTTNSGGTWYGKDIIFTTETLGFTAPSTDYATGVLHNSAQLVGSFSNLSGYTTTSWIEYGTTPAYGTKTLDAVYASAGPVNIAANVSLLQSGTTYHFRLVTSNAGGTWYGRDGIFTTLSLSNTGTTTGNATSVYDTYATLTGSFSNPSGNTTSQWFEYGATTAYGLATPATDYASMGTVSVATNISSLQSGTTYHFRLVTSNSSGTWYGYDNTFTTESLGYTAPTTDYYSKVEHNSAQLVGSFSNPAGYTTTSWIEYGTTPAYGAKTPDTFYASQGPVNIAVNISLLQPGTTYHFRLATSNAGGTWYGKDSTFTTLTPVETGVTTGSATNVHDTYATLTGSFLNFAGNTTSQWFEYGTTTAYGLTTTTANYSSTGAVSVATNISSLQPSTAYHFRLVTSNTGGIWYGFDNTFTTLSLNDPGATTGKAADIYDTSATLKGSFTNPPGTVTSQWFEYGATATYGTTTPLTNYASPGATNVATYISPLIPGNTYHFRLATSNASGIWYGNDNIFTTPIALQNPSLIYTAASRSTPQQIVMDATSIYWTEVAYPLTSTSGSVFKKLKSDAPTVLPTELATGLNAPFGIAVDATSVYFTEEGGTLRKVALAGGGSGCTLTTTITATGNIATVGVNTGGTGYSINEILNVLDVPAGAGVGGQVLVTSIGAGGAVTGVTLNVVANPVAAGTGYTAAPAAATSSGGVLLISGLLNPQYIAVDATNIYFTEYGTWNSGFGLQNYDGTINSAPLGGGVLQTVLASGLNGPKAIAIDATNIYWVEVANSASGAGAIKSVPIAGGAVTALVSGLSGSQYIGTDTGSIYYWQEYGTLAKVAKAGGQPTVLVTGMSGMPPLAVNDTDTNIYWAESSFGGPLKKTPKIGGNVTVIATGVVSSQSISLDATNIYWVDFDPVTSYGNPAYSGQINKVLK